MLHEQLHKLLPGSCPYLHFQTFGRNSGTSSTAYRRVIEGSYSTQDDLESKVSSLTTAVEELKESVDEQTNEIKRLQEQIDDAEPDQPDN